MCKEVWKEIDSVVNVLIHDRSRSRWDKFVRSLKRSKDVVRRNNDYVTIRLSFQGYREYTRVMVMVLAIVMIGQFLDTAASINYSDDVAKAINFIGQRPGYGSSVPVTVALLQRRIPLCSLFHDYAPDQANTLLTLVVTRMPAAGKLRKTVCAWRAFHRRAT